jgi:hypothetical protein
LWQGVAHEEEHPVAFFDISQTTRANFALDVPRCADVDPSPSAHSDRYSSTHWYMQPILATVLLQFFLAVLQYLLAVLLGHGIS